MIIAISTCAERLAVHVESGQLVANVDAENRLCVVVSIQPLPQITILRKGLLFPMFCGAGTRVSGSEGSGWC